MNPLKPMFMAAKKAATLEIYLYDFIGKDAWTGEGVDATDIAAAIKDAGDFDSILLRINSPGGSVWQGSAIYSQLMALGKPIVAQIDGMAASAAFTVAMAGHKIVISESAMMMLHNAFGVCMGESKDMRQTADMLDKVCVTMGDIYAKRSGQPREAITAMMDAETWLTPGEAVQNGFADEVLTTSVEDSEAMKALASQMLARSKVVQFGKVPDQFKPVAEPKQEVAPEVVPAPKQSNVAGCDCQCDECMANDCADCSDDQCDDEACKEAADSSDEGMRARNLARARLAEHIAFLHR